MKERPIPFNSEMVRAILDGRKTMTRRLIKPQSVSGIVFKDELVEKCRYGQPGDRLWVRETWGIYSGGEDGDLIPGTIPSSSLVYRATDDMGDLKGWKPSLFMPRWASRITLEIVDVRVERLQDIRESQARKEGFIVDDPDKGLWAIDQFVINWQILYTKKPEYQWQANPWCWCISFRRIK